MAEKYYKDLENAPYGVARLGDKYTLLDIFDKFPKRERNFSNFYCIVVCAGIFGATLPISYNVVKNRRLYSNPLLTLLSSGGFVAISYIANYYREKSDLRNEAICRDYIRLHPELFPPVERKKFKDCLHQWTASRWIN